MLKKREKMLSYWLSCAETIFSVTDFLVPLKAERPKSFEAESETEALQCPPIGTTVDGPDTRPRSEPDIFDAQDAEPTYPAEAIAVRQPADEGGYSKVMARYE